MPSTQDPFEEAFRTEFPALASFTIDKLPNLKQFFLTQQIQISRYVPNISSQSDVAALLAESVGNPTTRILEELMESCTQDDFPALWIASYSGTAIGVLRLESQDQSHCTITHVAVRQSFKGQGIGRKLVEFIHDDLNFGHAEAETDDDSVGFYKSCGFKVEESGENGYGTKRYKCVVRF